MPYEFEKFEYTGGSYEPKISVRSNGSLGFSQGALRRFGLWDGDWFVQLYFDRKQNVIGIELRDFPGAGTARLVKKKIEGKFGRQTVNAYVAAKSFFDFYGLDYSETRSYVAKRDEEANMIVVELAQPASDADNERTRRHSSRTAATGARRTSHSTGQPRG